jgi:hypothetical protein
MAKAMVLRAAKGKAPFSLSASRLQWAPGTSFIGGKWVPATCGSSFPVENPATQRVLASSVPDMGAPDAVKAIEAASEAFKGKWPVMLAKVGAAPLSYSGCTSF